MIQYSNTWGIVFSWEMYSKFIHPLSETVDIPNCHSQNKSSFVLPRHILVCFPTSLSLSHLFLILFLLNLIRFFLRFLAFSRPIGMPNIQEVIVSNPTHSLTLQLISISGNQPDFHSSFFISKVIKFHF